MGGKNTSATVVPDEKQLLSLVGRNEVLGEWSFPVLACFLRVRWVSAVLVLESKMHQTHYVQVHPSYPWTFFIWQVPQAEFEDEEDHEPAVDEAHVLKVQWKSGP